MKPKHLLSVRDLTGEQIRHLLQETVRMKRNRKQERILEGKTLGLLFQKPSVRTRVSFEVGMAQLGGWTLYIGPVELQEGQREGSKDLGQVLSRYLDGIVTRTFSHEQVVEMAQWATIPVINGLSDFSHPCQALSDLFTIQEKLGRLEGARVAYIGDGNNVCHSLIEACALTGIRLTVATPAGYGPDKKVIQWAKARASQSGGRTEWTQDPVEAVQNAAVVYTDVWTSMGQEKEKARRRRAFRGFQVNSALLKRASKGAFFMHCLPAHRGEEVSDEVMDSRYSIVYDQAENRLHVQKAILLTLMKKR